MIPMSNVYQGLQEIRRKCYFIYEYKIHYLVANNSTNCDSFRKLKRKPSTKIAKSYLLNQDFGRHALILMPRIIFLDILYILLAKTFLEKVCRLQKNFQQLAVYDMKCYRKNLSFNSKSFRRSIQSLNFDKFNLSTIRGGSDGTPRSSQSIIYI
jgi:hypothetical protein